MAGKNKPENHQDGKAPLEAKLAQMRNRLLDDVPLDELQRLQVHTQLLENALRSGTNDHHHDTNEHHDHVYITLTAEGDPQRVRR